MDLPSLPLLSRNAHIHHVTQALAQIPAAMVDLDSSRMLIIFYCISTLDLLGEVDQQTTLAQRESWRSWIWDQYIAGPLGTAFKPGTSMKSSTPHIISTYAAILSLAALRDDFSRLSQPGILTFLRVCQRADGSFASTPPLSSSSTYSTAEGDMRNIYCAFCICSLFGETGWRAINVQQAIDFVGRCRTYEGGYGQLPGCEAQGGTTFLAIACLQMAPPPAASHRYGPQHSRASARLSSVDRARSENWLVHNQVAPSGGFRGRTGKPPDSCYCFWGGAALRILGAQDKIDAYALIDFISRCQFTYGGIAKAPDEFPDPYHTYLALAAAALYAPILPPAYASSAGWHFAALNPLVNACEETVRWAQNALDNRSSNEST